MMMFARRALLAAGIVALAASTAEARGSYLTGGHYRASHVAQPFGRYLAHRHFRYLNRRLAHHHPRHVDPPRTRLVHINYDRGQILPHPAGCPARLFCGCGASIEAFGKSVRELWLANNWLHFPRTTPAPGMAVVWPGRHVAIIRQYHGNGVATLYDANSGGGLTRLHRRSIAGLVVVDPHVHDRRRALYSYPATVPL